MRNFVRQRPFTSFYVIAVGIASLLWTYAIVAEVVAPNAFGPGISIADHYFATRPLVLAQYPYLTAHSDGVPASILSYIAVPAVAPFLFFPGAPTVAALLVVATGWGGRGLGALLSLYKPVLGSLNWRDGVRLYIMLLLLIAGVAGCSVLASYFLAGEGYLEHLGKAFGLQSIGFFASVWIVALFANQGGLLEELGWRGYAWPRLVHKFGAPLMAAIVLGVLWALWHFPREVPLLLSGQTSVQDLAWGQARFIVNCIASSIVMVYFVNLSGGSVWPAIMIHGFLNLLFEAMRLEAPNAGGAGSLWNNSIIVWVIAATVVLIIAGRDLGWRQRQAIHAGDGSTDPANLWSKL